MGIGRYNQLGNQHHCRNKQRKQGIVVYQLLGSVFNIHKSSSIFTRNRWHYKFELNKVTIRQMASSIPGWIGHKEQVYHDEAKENFLAVVYCVLYCNDPVCNCLD